MPEYLSRPGARDYLRERGVKIGDDALKDHASRGTGPRYTIINGRALYTRAWCDAWINEQAARPVMKRGRSSNASTAA